MDSPAPQNNLPHICHQLGGRSHSLRHWLLAGIILSLLVHGSWIALTLFQSFARYGDLLAIQLISRPAPGTGSLDLLDHPRHMYYPAGLHGQKPGAVLKKTEKRRPKPKPPEPPPPPPQPPDLETSMAQVESGLHKALTLDIGPIKSQVAAVYKAQVEGKITVDKVSLAIRFKVEKGGRISHITLVESSGISELDSAAVNIASQLGQFWALAPLGEPDSVLFRMSIGPEVEFHARMAAPSSTEAQRQSDLFNSLLLAARIWLATKDEPDANRFLSSLSIRPEGAYVSANAHFPRDRAWEILRYEMRERK